MSGLENIKSRILEEADHSAQLKIDKAKEEAQSLIESARNEAKEQEEKIMLAAGKKAKDLKDRAVSALDMERRKEVLRTKRLLIEEVLDEAYARLSQEKNENYRTLLLRLVDKYALDKEGVIRFSKSDGSVLNDEFKQSVAEAAAKRGGKLTVGEPADVDGGFVLVYGGIEENCTIKALFDAKRDELADEVNRLLFLADA